MSVTLGQAEANAQQQANQTPPAPRVSIVILNWNTRELTLQCLYSLKHALGDLHAQIIVVDNDSTDGSAAAIAKHHPDICLVRIPEIDRLACGNIVALRQ